MGSVDSAMYKAHDSSSMGLADMPEKGSFSRLWISLVALIPTIPAVRNRGVLIVSGANEKTVLWLLFPGKGPVFIITAHLHSLSFWKRPSEGMEKYREKGCACDISGLTGYRKYSDLRRKQVCIFSWMLTGWGWSSYKVISGFIRGRFEPAHYTHSTCNAFCHVMT